MALFWDLPALSCTYVESPKQRAAARPPPGYRIEKALIQQNEYHAVLKKANVPILFGKTTGSNLVDVNQQLPIVSTSIK